MTIQGITSQNAGVLSEQMQKMQDFKDGKINITKDELKNSLTSAISKGNIPSDSVVYLVDYYEKIDTNGDGISYTELQTYQNTKEGMINSILSSYSLNKQSSLLNAGSMNDSSNVGEMCLLDYGIIGNDDKNTDVTSIMRSYSPYSASSSGVATTPSLLDIES